MPFPPIGSSGGATGAAVGTGTLTFSDANDGTFAYTVNGISQTKAITRQTFGPVPLCTFGAQANLALTQQLPGPVVGRAGRVASGLGRSISRTRATSSSSTWFTYDVDHTPMWLVATAGQERVGARIPAT